MNVHIPFLHVGLPGCLFTSSDIQRPKTICFTHNNCYMNFSHAGVSIRHFYSAGIEKLNDLTTKYFHSASNHRDIESLKQISQKQNCLESLENCGYQCTKRIQKCGVCKLPGYDKCFCPNRN